MALQMAYDDLFGSTHPNAYHRITLIEMNIAEQSARVKMSSYVDAAARQSGKSPVGERFYRFTGTEYDLMFDPGNMSPANKNPTKNAYDFLKGRPEWGGAVDV